ncbi:hypothetical protein Oweho_1964 [Owenweeksia hongkongensis DSM 17368]|uniref:Uncharacterized protein n=1 Tax=Owenweeksia hongkongensis (strain DSM 17368 / CIP 108786 / JCM 12287 / NRRL B-23963 / UST20020801) TaxID=926562 RepID=G8R2F3_OWEHD|nr:hypothetical protein [Owenweeksia hongkongensis]AEV32943.1 hypothetical protein Oweho_1964 [Owenweeksia hongkongensis DSM 17368]
MRKYLKGLFFLSALLQCQLSISQPSRLKFDLGTPTKEFQGNFRYFLGGDAQNVYSRQPEGRGNFIFKMYDGRYYREKYQVHVDGKTGKYGEYKGLVLSNGSARVFSSDFDAKADIMKLLVKTVDKDGRESDFSILSQFATDKKGTGNYVVRASKDNSKIVVFKIYQYDEEGNEKAGVEVYDYDLKLLWKKDYELDYLDKDFRFQDIKLSNNGDVYAIGKYFTKDNSILSIHKFTEAGNKELPVEMVNYGISNFELDADAAEGMLYCYGWLVLSGGGKQHGVDLRVVDQQKFLYSEVKELVFNEELTNLLRREKRFKGKPRIFADFDFKGLVAKPDGSLYLLAEKYYERGYESSSGHKVTEERYFGEILAVSINVEHKVDFMKVVPKNQLAKAGDFMDDKYSFAKLVDKDGNLHIYYNDDPENKNYVPGTDEPAEMKKVEKSVLVDYTIMVDGSTEYNIIKQNSSEHLPEFRLSKNIEPNVTLISIAKKRGGMVSIGTMILL